MRNDQYLVVLGAACVVISAIPRLPAPRSALHGLGATFLLVED